MVIGDYLRAVKYSWNTYNLRRSDLPWRNKNKDKEVMNWDQSELLNKKLSKIGRGVQGKGRKH